LARFYKFEYDRLGMAKKTEMDKIDIVC